MHGTPSGYPGGAHQSRLVPTDETAIRRTGKRARRAMKKSDRIELVRKNRSDRIELVRT